MTTLLADAPAVTEARHAEIRWRLRTFRIELKRSGASQALPWLPFSWEAERDEATGAVTIRVLSHDQPAIVVEGASLPEAADRLLEVFRMRGYPVDREPRRRPERRKRRALRKTLRRYFVELRREKARLDRAMALASRRIEARECPPAVAAEWARCRVAAGSRGAAFLVDPRALAGLELADRRRAVVGWLLLAGRAREACVVAMGSAPLLPRAELDPGPGTPALEVCFLRGSRVLRAAPAADPPGVSIGGVK